MVVLSILGITIGTLAIENVRLTRQEQDYQAAFYIAEAGLNEAYIEASDIIATNATLFNQSDSFFNQLTIDLTNQLHNKTYNHYEVNTGKQPTAQVQIERIEGSGDARAVRLLARGQIGQRTQTVRRDFIVKWNKIGVLPYIPPGTAGMIRTKMNLRTTINGDLYIGSGVSGAVELDWGTNFNGDLYAPDNYANDLIAHPNNYNNVPNIEDYTFGDTFNQFDALINQFPVFNPPSETISNIQLQGGTNETITQSSDVFIEEISINSNRTLTIDTEGNDINIYLERLLVKQGMIEIVGGGTVNLYISERFQIGNRNGGGSSQLNTTAATDQLNVYYSGTESVQIGGGNAVNGSLFNKQADLSFGNGQSFTGFIVSGGDAITVSGGATTDGYFLAPKATFNFENGTINGFIAVQELITKGGATLNVSEVDTSQFPFGIEAGSGENKVEIIPEPTIID